MKTILCYGDSNTWGYDPTTGSRLPFEQRWPGVLAADLGDEYRVIEEGQCGRTTVWDDPVEGGKNGQLYLGPCLESHQPLDLVVLMLGTNDLKLRFSVSPYDVSLSIGRLVDQIQKSGAGQDKTAPEVLLLAPPLIGPLTDYAEMFPQDARERSAKLGAYYASVATAYRTSFLDTSDLVTASELDGIHFAAGEHAKLGRAVAECIREILSA
ncbi:MAG: SGNH/GDSL hydrolase family protein [Rudaea sp.]